MGESEWWRQFEIWAQDIKRFCDLCIFMVKMDCPVSDVCVTGTSLELLASSLDDEYEYDYDYDYDYDDDYE